MENNEGSPASSTKEIDYPTSSDESRRLSTDEYSNSSSPPKESQMRVLRNRVCLSTTQSVRKNRVADDEQPHLTHPTTKTMYTQRREEACKNDTHIPNRYKMLADVHNDPDPVEEDENSDEEAYEEAETVEQDQTQTQTKKSQPLPIIVHQRLTNCKQLINQLKNAAPAGFNIKLTQKATSIYVANKSQETVVKDLLRKEGLGFHSYSQKEQKTHAFVLQGLDEDVLPEEILEELVALKVNAVKAFKMRNTRNPKFLIITDKTVTMRHLTKTVRVINYTRISWERYNNKWEATQCHRCQKWGHATTNCEAEPACLKCAGGHLTASCTQSTTTKPKCANCGGEHLARCAECPVYASIVNRKLDQRRRNEPQRQGRYVPAPPPQINVWEQRKAERAQRTQEPREIVPSRPGPPLGPPHGPPLGPPLGPPPESRQRPTQGQPPVPPLTNVWETRGSSGVQGLDAIVSMNHEFARFSNHINLSKFLQLLKSLNDKLDHAQTGMEKFQLMSTFANYVNTNGLL